MEEDAKNLKKISEDKENVENEQNPDEDTLLLNGEYDELDLNLDDANYW